MSSFLDEINKNNTSICNDNQTTTIAENSKKPDNNNNINNNSINNNLNTNMVNKASGISSTEHDIEIDHSYNKNKLIRIVVVFALIIVLLVGLFIVVRQLNKIEVINFEGKSISEMRTWSIKNKIQLDEEFIFNDSVSDNIVITQSIDAGKKISPKTVINVTVSDGPDPDEIIPVPDIKSMTAPEIKNWINEYQLENVNLSEEKSDTVEEGNVIRFEFSDIAVDADNFKRSDYLRIYISNDRYGYDRTIKVPDFTELSKAKVDQWASKYDINVKYEEKLSDTIDEGKVISQDLEKDTVVEEDDEINIVLSAGEGLVVPNYSNVFKDDAISYDPDFVVIVETVYNLTIPYGEFISQDVASGTKVFPEKNKITVVFSEGKPFLRSLKGMAENELPGLFYTFAQNGVNITYESTYVDSSQPKGTVIWASKGNEYISLNEEIEIKISNGSDSIQNKEIIVPDYSDVLKDNAAEYNKDINVTIKTQYSDTANYGELISQSVESGTKISGDNNDIILVYSDGKPYIKDLVGMTLEDLDKYLYDFNINGANIDYDIVSISFDNELKDDVVIEAAYGEEFLDNINATIEIKIVRGTKK